MYVALGHESRVVVAPKRPTLRSLTNKWVQIALVKPVKVNVFFFTCKPQTKHPKTNAKTQSAKGSASIRILRVLVIIVVVVII